LRYPKRADDVLHRYEEKQELGILFDQRTGKFKLLNPVAYEVWKLCDGSHTTDEIVEEIVRTFEVSKEQASSDISKVLADMKDQQLIVFGDKAERPTIPPTARGLGCSHCGKVQRPLRNSG